MNKHRRHLINIGFLCSLIAWYDFIIYANLAVELGKLFFSFYAVQKALILVFLLFALSYLVRPLGALIFGYIGDRYGAAIALQYVLLSTTLPAVFIGIIPTFAEVGYFATFLLIILRIIQGFGSGGDIPSGASYLYEHSEKSLIRVFYCNLPYLGSLAGIICASFVVFLIHSICTPEQILAWAWRIPFWLGAPLMIFIFYARREITKYAKKSDTEFNDDKEQHTKIKLKNFIKPLALVSFLELSFYVLFIWMPSYLQQFVHISAHQALLSNLIALIVLLISSVSLSLLTRVIRYDRLVLFAISSITCLVYPLFTHLSHATFTEFIFIQILFAFMLAGVNGIILFIVCASFSKQIHNRAVAISVTLPAAIIGGTAPLICTSVIHYLGMASFPAWYIVFVGIVAILAMLFG